MRRNFTIERMKARMLADEEANKKPKEKLAMNPNKKERVTITLGQYEAEQGNDAGLCLGCGAWAYGVEPDARKYECESCGEERVYGLEECLMMGRVL